MIKDGRLPKYNGRFLRVRNLGTYQHYKNRNPPWIKLHQTILEDYDFAALPDAAKWHAVAITLLAARTDNEFPFDAKWIGARINARSRVDLDALVSISFLEVCGDASGSLAECGQSADSEERRDRGEKRAITKRYGDPEFLEFWMLYPRSEGKAAAWKAWLAAEDKPPLKDLLAAVRAAAEQCTELKYLPHGSTWLNQRRWEDFEKKAERAFSRDGIIRMDGTMRYSEAQAQWVPIDEWVAGQ